MAVDREMLGGGWRSGEGLAQARGAAGERLPDNSLVEWVDMQRGGGRGDRAAERLDGSLWLLDGAWVGAGAG